MLKDNLKKLRKQAGYNQKQIAEYLNIERSTYTNYERGIREPNLDTIKKLAILFKTTTDEILDMKNFEEKQINKSFNNNGNFTNNGNISF